VLYFKALSQCLLKETEENQKSLTGLPAAVQTPVSDKNMGHVCWYVVGYTKPSKLSNVTGDSTLPVCHIGNTVMIV
jgi:hypothetical protein